MIGVGKASARRARSLVLHTQAVLARRELLNVLTFSSDYRVAWSTCSTSSFVKRFTLFPLLDGCRPTFAELSTILFVRITTGYRFRCLLLSSVWFDRRIRHSPHYCTPVRSSSEKYGPVHARQAEPYTSFGI